MLSTPVSNATTSFRRLPSLKKRWPYQKNYLVRYDDVDIPRHRKLAWFMSNLVWILMGAVVLAFIAALVWQLSMPVEHLPREVDGVFYYYQAPGPLDAELFRFILTTATGFCLGLLIIKKESKYTKAFRRVHQGKIISMESRSGVFTGTRYYVTIRGNTYANELRTYKARVHIAEWEDYEVGDFISL